MKCIALILVFCVALSLAKKYSFNLAHTQCKDSVGVIIQPTEVVLIETEQFEKCLKDYYKGVSDSDEVDMPPEPEDGSENIKIERIPRQKRSYLPGFGGQEISYQSLTDDQNVKYYIASDGQGNAVVIPVQIDYNNAKKSNYEGAFSNFGNEELEKLPIV